MPRPTGRGYAVLGIAAGTYVAGRVVGTWELYLFAFAFLAAVTVSWIVVATVGRKVQIKLALSPERPVAGDEAEFTYSVKNASLLPGPHLTLRNTLAGLSSETLELHVESLAPRDERVIRARSGRVNRGIHLLSPSQAIAEDPLGVARALRRVGDPLLVTVYPRIVPLESCAFYPDIGLRHDWTAQHGLLTPGASEFRGIRPHQPGEPLSHIDWKSTARTGVLMLREMEEPAGSDVSILLDGTAGKLTGDPPDTNFELAVRAAGSMADFALRAGRGVSLLRHEDDWKHAQLGADSGGRRMLMEILAEAEPSAPAPLLNALRHLRTDRPRLLRAQSVTIVSISLDRHLVRALIGLREDGVRLGFLYVAGSSFDGAALGPATSLLPFLPPRDTAGAAHFGAAPSRATSNELPTDIRSLLHSLSSAGIPCLTIFRSDDLMRVLSRLPTGRLRAGSQ